jgi:hypothetical protein
LVDRQICAGQSHRFFIRGIKLGKPEFWYLDAECASKESGIFGQNQISRFALQPSDLRQINSAILKVSDGALDC